MKKHNFKLNGASRMGLNESYRQEFGADTVSTQAYEIGDGICDYYTQLHYKVGVTAVLHEDHSEIVLKSGNRSIMTVDWNDETVCLLKHLNTMTAGEALAVLACHSKAV